MLSSFRRNQKCPVNNPEITVPEGRTRTGPITPLQLPETIKRTDKPANPKTTIQSLKTPKTTKPTTKITTKPTATTPKPKMKKKKFLTATSLLDTSHI